MNYQDFESYNFYNSHAFNVFTNAESRSYRNHWHTYGEIILVGGGEKNIYRVNQSSYDLDNGDIVLIWPMEQHEIIDADRMTSIVVQFGNAFGESLFDMQRIMHFFHDLHIIRKSRHTDTVNELTALIREMKDIYYSEGHNRELRGCMKLMEFMLILDEHRGELKNDIGVVRQSNVPDETVKKIVEVTDFIKNNLATEDLSQTAMAGRAGISNEYFSRVFKDLTGINYNRWLNMIRVDKAISLFENDKMKLTEIAMLSGFQSIPSFNRVFKELKGIAPGEYRNMNT